MQKAITSVRICNPHMLICHYGFVIHRKVKQKVTDIQQSDFQLLQDYKSVIIPCADCKSART